MESSNTSINEEWFCSVTPFDTSGIGYQVNSSRVTILSDAPPLINSIECQEDNSTWSSCTIIGFNDYLTKPVNVEKLIVTINKYIFEEK